MILTCECGGKVSTEAKQCPHCGKPGPFAPPPPPDHTQAWAASIVLTLIGLGLLYWWLN